MTDSDKSEISVSAGGVTIKSEGEASGRQTNAFLDLVSIFTEGGGVLGDQLRYFRQRSAVKAMQRAKQLADEEGLKLQPVPQKFLVQWIDKASLEDDQNNELTDMWAQLLKSASTNEDSIQIAYIDVLSRLDKTDAEILSYLAFDASPGMSKRYHQLSDEREFEANLPKFLREQAAKLKTNGDIIEIIEGIGLQFNLYVTEVWVGGAPMFTESYSKRHRNLASLEQIGCLARHQIAFTLGKLQIRVAWVELTKFGFDFVWACEGRITDTLDGSPDQAADEED